MNASNNTNQEDKEEEASSHSGQHGGGISCSLAVQLGKVHDGGGKRGFRTFDPFSNLNGTEKEL